jgi:DNA modification methylase
MNTPRPKPTSPLAIAPVKRIPLSKMNPAPYNPRKDLQPGDPEYQALDKSMHEFGLVEFPVWNKRTGHLVGGHQRVKIAKASGLTAIDVCVVDLPLDKEKTLNIALNKIAGDWDQAKLAALLADLTSNPELDVSLTGFHIPEVSELLERYGLSNGSGGDDAEFDAAAALDTKHPAVTKLGELLVLGAHRLLCGDATKPADVRRLMDGERAALFATDPPYLVNYDGMNHPGSGPRKNKDWSGTYGVTWDDAQANPDLYDRFIGVAIAEAIQPDAAWYCWHASARQAMVQQMWEKHGAFVHCQIIWGKNRQVLSRTWYAWMHEPCFMGWIKGKRPRRADKQVLPTLWSIDTIPNGEQRPDHPTPKPVRVFEIPMRQHTRPGEICYEPFAGSGTQIVAAEQLGRRCFSMEISPHYCDVIVRRWIHLVGEAKAPAALRNRFGAARRAGRKGAAA